MADDPYLTDGKTDTSRAAGESIRAHASRCEGIFLDAVRKRGAYGATCYEVTQLTRMRHQTASARQSALRYKKMIVDSGRRRPTDTGCMAIVWVAAGEK